MQVESVNSTVSVGNVRVEARDLVVADASGVVIIPRHRVEEVATIAKQIEASEEVIREHLRQGETLGAARKAAGLFGLVIEDGVVDTFHLVGHSMGGLTALMLTQQNSKRVMSFVEIEGNIAPEDCFLSRQIISHDHADPHQFLLSLLNVPAKLPLLAVHYMLSTKFARVLFAAFLNPWWTFQITRR